MVGVVVVAATAAAVGSVVGLGGGVLVNAAVGSVSTGARASAGGVVVEAALRKPDVWLVGLASGLRVGGAGTRHISLDGHCRRRSR